MRTALATFDYKRSHQDNIRGLVGCITRQLEELKRTGHPRWREVDLLDIDKLHWPVHPAARQAIRDARRGKSAPADFPRYDRPGLPRPRCAAGERKTGRPAPFLVPRRTWRR